MTLIYLLFFLYFLIENLINILFLLYLSFKSMPVSSIFRFNYFIEFSIIRILIFTHSCELRNIAFKILFFYLTYQGIIIINHLLEIFSLMFPKIKTIESHF